MKHINLIFLCLIMIAVSACSQKKETDILLEPQPLISEANASDEASLLAAAKDAGVLQDDALAAKAEFEKIYNETNTQMDEAEQERNARFKQLKDGTCVANCPDD